MQPRSRPGTSITSTRLNNIQQEREALGQRLREFRQRTGRTGKELAEALGWQASKISKIELGRQTPSESDITAWTRATGTDHARSDLLASLHTLELRYAEWQRQLRTGTHARQQALVDIEAKATTIRAFESTYIPGLLQTAGYAQHRLAEIVHVYGVPNDVDQGVHTRMRRQETLYQPGRRFHFVMTEAALRYLTCPPEILEGQLDRLLALISMRTLKVGVIPFDTRYPVSPIHGFWVYDDRMVLVETFSAELTLAQPQEIRLYSKIFERLASAAQYGSEARATVNRALDDLTKRPD
ncbi:MAG: helix-turn-helix domain-containing protein [Nitriliruptorales bacterium]|nr:helix-turn-helix domain-containing protein [Nitriliruptorales bacterium]